MSALLALTAAMAGTTFVCEGGEARFSVYAPGQEAVAQSEEPLDLYAFDPLSEGVWEDWTLHMVDDSWPEALRVTFEDPGSGKPELSVAPGAAGSADFVLAYDATPLAARATGVTLEGACTVAAEGRPTLSPTVAGTIFTCEAGTAYLSLFAPDEEVTANHRGNILTLYSIAGDGEILPQPVKIRQVFDGMPYGLGMSVTADDLKVEIEIDNVDQAAGTADLALTGVQADETMEIAGSCTLGRSDGKEDA